MIGISKSKFNSVKLTATLCKKKFYQRCLEKSKRAKAKKPSQYQRNKKVSPKANQNQKTRKKKIKRKARKTKSQRAPAQTST